MPKIRVYDPKGDFTIEVPEDAKVTFGYFNPAAPKFGDGGGTNVSGFDRSAPNVARQTALRIYEGAVTKKNQIAVFLGVTGYRYEHLKVVRLEEAVTIIRTYDDDPETGITLDSTKRQQTLKAIPEKGQYS
jgi:hypothetical protein